MQFSLSLPFCTPAGRPHQKRQPSTEPSQDTLPGWGPDAVPAPTSYLQHLFLTETSAGRGTQVPGWAARADSSKTSNTVLRVMWGWSGASRGPAMILNGNIIWKTWQQEALLSRYLQLFWKLALSTPGVSSDSPTTPCVTKRYINVTFLEYFRAQYPALPILESS